MNQTVRISRAWTALATLAFLLIAAAPLFAAQPVPDATREVYEAIERGRQALLADHYAEADQQLEQVLKMPAFAEIEQPIQYSAFLFAAIAADGNNDNLSAHEYAVIATEFPFADANAWTLRANTAWSVEAWPDAGTAIKTIAEKWPKSLADLSGRLVNLVAHHMDQDKKLAGDRLALLNALFDAKFTSDWQSQPSHFWSDLALDALARKDLGRAREVLKRINDPNTLVTMRVDRRFDELLHAEPKAFDVAAAAQEECKRWRKIVAANPRKLDPVVQYMYALLVVGDYPEIMTRADDVLARNARATKEKPVFEDTKDQLNWIYDLKSQALRGLGRFDDGLAVQKSAGEQRDASSDKVSQAINLGFAYNSMGRPQDALSALEGIDWGKSLSGYGRMQLEHVRLEAYLQQGKRDQAEEVFNYMREHQDDAPDDWQGAMLEWGDVDGAAAHYVARLHDPDQRAQALYSAQDFAEEPATPRQAEEKARWHAFIARADVSSAISEVGRREKQPIHNISD